MFDLLFGNKAVLVPAIIVIAVLIICFNTPADSLCPECAIKLNRCIHCGVELDKED